MEERKMLDIEIRSILNHVEEILKYIDKYSDIDNFTFHIDDGPDPKVHITAYFADGGMKNLVTDTDLYNVVTDIFSCIGGPRVYIMSQDQITETLSDLREKYKDQLTDKERAAVNAAIQIIITGHVAPINYYEQEDE